MALHKQDWFARPKIWTIVSSQESRLQEGQLRSVVIQLQKDKEDVRWSE